VQSESWLAALENDQASLGRTSTAERVAEILRTRIAEGSILPEERLPEKEIVAALKVSRNTLREAFRLLTHEHLVTHRLNRGVFVRKLTVDDVLDLYRVRRIVECGAVRSLTRVPPLHDVVAAVEEGERAAKQSAWQNLGTADIHFHSAIVALGESPRTDELMQGVLAELRLVFHVVKDPRRFHEPYLVRNRAILERLEARDTTGAEQLLAQYLDDARRQLVRAYAEKITA
jgi:DNA-binding GntR family transcriptional regulator